MADTTHERTLAADIINRGGGGLPTSALEAFHEREVKRRALTTDRKISDEHRHELLTALDVDTDARLHTARDQEVAAALKAHDAREGAILAQIKGTTTMKPEFETEAERAERHFRHTTDITALLADLIVFQAATDPAELVDAFDEAIAAGRPDRVQKIAPVIISQLAALKARKVEGADAAHSAAASEYMTFRRNHPSLASQLRAVRKERRFIEKAIEDKYQRAREVFTFGSAAHGVRA